jgi:pyruvate dehydrogenase E1 component alpha subunit
MCINNGYAASLSFKDSTSVETNAVRAAGYSMPGYDVNGTDVWEVYCVSRESAERARTGNGPSLIQVNTARWKGHDPNDDANYRPEEELQTWNKYDPVRITKEKILQEGILNEEEIADTMEEIKTGIDEAVQWSLKQAFPSCEDYLADVKGKY